MDASGLAAPADWAERMASDDDFPQESRVLKGESVLRPGLVDARQVRTGPEDRSHPQRQQSRPSQSVM